jgi:hypothetical protein
MSKKKRILRRQIRNDALIGGVIGLAIAVTIAAAVRRLTGKAKEPASSSDPNFALNGE